MCICSLKDCTRNWFEFKFRHNLTEKHGVSVVQIINRQFDMTVLNEDVLTPGYPRVGLSAAVILGLVINKLFQDKLAGQTVVHVHVFSCGLFCSVHAA